MPVAHDSEARRLSDPAACPEGASCEDRPWRMVRQPLRPAVRLLPTTSGRQRPIRPHHDLCHEPLYSARSCPVVLNDGTSYLNPAWAVRSIRRVDLGRWAAPSHCRASPSRNALSGIQVHLCHRIRWQMDVISEHSWRSDATRFTGNDPLRRDASQPSNWIPSTGAKTRRAPDKVGGSSEKSGGVLLSQGVSSQVPSAQVGLTSVFGMGTGVTPPPWPPKSVVKRRARKRALHP